MSQAKSVAKVLLTAIAVVGGIWAGAKKLRAINQGLREKEEQEKETKRKQETEKMIRRITAEEQKSNWDYSSIETTGIQDAMEMFVEVKADNGNWKRVESTGIQDYSNHPEAAIRTRKVAQEHNRRARLVDKYRNLYHECDENGIFWGLSS